MPTYEYQCQKCGYRFEAWQKMTEQPLASCPKCQGKLKRLISSGAGIIFKGSGFYATDYRSKEYKQKQRQENGAQAPACPASGGNQASKKSPKNKNA